jgi:hypothetical protein
MTTKSPTKPMAPHHGIGEEDIDSVNERGRDDYGCGKKRLDLKGRHGVRFLGCCGSLWVKRTLTYYRWL